MFLLELPWQLKSPKITHLSNYDSSHIPRHCPNHFSSMTSPDLSVIAYESLWSLEQLRELQCFPRRPSHSVTAEADGWASCPDHTRMRWHALALWCPKSLSCTHLWPGTAGITRLCDGCGRRQWDVIPAIGDPNHIPSSLVWDVSDGIRAIFIISGQWLFWVSPLGPVDHREMLFRMLSSNHSRKTLTHFAH